MNKVLIAKEFYTRLVNRDTRQGDGSNNAIDFRNRFLKSLDDPYAWKTKETVVELDFSGVEKLGPSFANEAFAYFTKYATPEDIKRKIIFSNISKIKEETIDIELQDGYSRK